MAAEPLRAFYQRVQARRGLHIAAAAITRTLAVLGWHLILKGDEAFTRPFMVLRVWHVFEDPAKVPEADGGVDPFGDRR
jgi:hypothetical protein